jgi:diguanylate cyclase (GGDEF)-like protein
MSDVDPTTSPNLEPSDTPRSGRRLRWDIYLVVSVAAAAVHATGLAGDVMLIALSLATPIAGVIAVRTYRPLSATPWVLLILAGIVWSVAGTARAAADVTGQLGADRNLLPDVPAIAGYALFAVGLLMMQRAHGKAGRSWALTLDGGIMALSAMLVFWVTLVAPVIFRLEAAPIAKLSIVIYPPISAGLVWIAARLAFGATVRGRSFQLLLAGMLALLIGDVAYVPLETHLLSAAPAKLLELPYALAYALLGAAILHPSMRNAVRPAAPATTRQEARFALIAVALLTPSMMLLVWSPLTNTERIVVGALAVVLEVAAIARVVLAARAQDAVEQRLAYRASRDELTGLINRPAALDLIDEVLDDAVANRTEVGVMFVDLDRFKLVNDSYGHAVGDELLLVAADRLRTTVGPLDTVARLSGDEFLIVAPDTGIARARELAARVCDVFTQPFELIGTAWVSASIGVVVSDGRADGVDATSLIRDADTAMYQAKAAGRSGFALFHPSMRAASERQLEVYNGLHRALERDEFEAHYQIIVDRRSGTVHGVEALVRWQSPEGMVPPDEFISLAEDSGLISEIGELVLRRSCAQVARWRRLPGCAGLTLSVNVSGRQFMDVDMVAVVADALDDAGLDPDALWLEITESVMMTDSLDTLATMSGLRSLGVHLSVDDFGTGHSSLSYLQRFPVEQVKIDRRFVTGMCDHSEDEAVVAAVVGIAKALGMSVVAEGVEEQRHVDRLNQYECDLMQGFLFSRPMPALDLGPILLHYNEVGHQPPFAR